MNPREERGLELAKAAKIRHTDRAWYVPSANGKGHHYSVNLDGDSPHCSCPDHEMRGAKCKHIYAAQYTLEQEVSPFGETTITETVTETEMVKVTYKQNWPAYNAAQTEEKHRFTMLLSALCRGIAEPEQPMGRPRLPLGDMVFASAYKVYVGFSSRRFTTDLHDAHTDGLIRSTPHFNSVSRYLSDPKLTGILKDLVTLSSLPLKAVETDFAVDSSGFSTCRFVRWFNKKYGRETDNREWVKAHLMCGVKTQIVTAVDIGGWAAHDTNYFIPLVERTAEHFQLEEVSADKAYSSHKNLQAVEKVGGMPFIPFKTNTVEPTEASTWARMYHLFMHKRDDFLEHYHKRSNIETAYSMIKGKFGSSLRSKSDSGQINEALCKVLCHNLCCLVQAIHELGIEPAF